MGWVSLLATAFSLIYILLATANKRICFLFGAIGALLWAYESFYNYNLKFDAVLQLFYIIMSIYGWIIWKSKDADSEKGINQMKLSQHMLFIVTGLLLSLGIAHLSLEFFHTNMPYLDATTTGFSIMTTFLLAKRYIDNWGYWIVINPIYAYIYFKTDADFFVGMMLVYTLMAIVGLVKWKKILT